MLDWRVWRHPRPVAESGLCIGRRTDAPIDASEARRCADEIAESVQREARERRIWTSTLRRARDVGYALAREGWTHHVEPDLDEFDFGDWDGRAWSSIAAEDVARWECDFLQSRVGGHGESLARLFERVDRCIDRLPARAAIVGHAGWINALLWRVERVDAPTAAEWPPPIAYAAHVHVRRA